MFNHKYRYLFIFILALYTYINTVLCEVYFYFNIDIKWYYAFLTILLITLGAWESSRLVKPLVQRKMQAVYQNKVKYLIVFFLTSLSLSVLWTVAVIAMMGLGLHELDIESSMIPLKLNLIYASLVTLLFHLMYAVFYFFKAYQRHWMEAQELKQVSTQAQLQLIKSQINPHFLFNNLNVLSGLIIKENPVANEFIEDFSKVYRHILSSQTQELVSLDSELEYVQSYVRLLEKRFPNSLLIKFNIASGQRKQLIIPVALQMLIENAIKHNIVSSSRPLYITITANETGLIVSNNLQKKEAVEYSSMIGLQNIQKRYELISGKLVQVESTETLFSVTLPLLYPNEQASSFNR